MDPIKNIGKLLKGDEERDCIHIAVLPCTVSMDGMGPGEEVGLVYGTKDHIKPMQTCYDLPAIGIIDPFIKQWRLKKGQRVYVFLFPGTVTGMRHHWEHPAIDQQQLPNNESEKWLREFADKWNFDYYRMVEEAQVDEGYATAMGRDLHGSDELDSGDETLFWYHIELLTGKKFNEEHRTKFGWSCSC